VLGSRVDEVKKILINSALLTRTINDLREAGSRGTERLVLWLGMNGARGCHVAEVFSPSQTVTEDSFWIDGPAMQSVLGHLRSTRLAVVAQVHSHPHEAFHSRADDTWAIVRHIGALSIVVPQFALQTTIESFLADVAAYELTAENRWRQVPKRQLEKSFLVRHGKS